MSVEVVHGQVKTVLRSGSDVRVKSGTAHIDLVEGGVLTICGPAHLSILKAQGSITVALETGTIHARMLQQPLLTVYTAQIKASPIFIGDAELDLLVGFDTPGAMCVRANRGAVRIEQQLTGQSVVIPQSGDVLLMNGALESLRTSTGRCICEAEVPAGIAEAAAAAQSEPAPEVSKLATAEEVRKRSFDAKPNLPEQPVNKPTPKEEPIYQVIVPPLVYIANAKVQPEIDPSMIILVRRVRVRPTVIFQGRVLGEPVVAPATVSAAGPSTAAAPTMANPAALPKPQAPAAKPVATPTMVDKVKTFIQKLWPSTP